VREAGRAFSPDPDEPCALCPNVAGRRSGGTGIRLEVEAFSAVVTTGIYCRPGCSARPHAKNVSTFALAAAAEAAGYRACRRCRPYRSPQNVSGSAQRLD